MKKNYKREKGINRLIQILFLPFLLFCAACSKETKEQIEIAKTQADVYAYEVTCTACEIQFMDKNKSIKNVTNGSGKWNYSFEKTNDAELKLIIKTTNTTYQNINAYILKNDEVIYGDLGYNNFELLYNIKSGQKSIKYGTYSPVTSSPGSNEGTSKPISSVCGAKNNTGGYCKRVVSGGGRCWQHK